MQYTIKLVEHPSQKGIYRITSNRPEVVREIFLHMRFEYGRGPVAVFGGDEVYWHPRELKLIQKAFKWQACSEDFYDL